MRGRWIVPDRKQLRDRGTSDHPRGSGSARRGERQRRREPGRRCPTTAAAQRAAEKKSRRAGSSPAAGWRIFGSAWPIDGRRARRRAGWEGGTGGATQSEEVGGGGYLLAWDSRGRSLPLSLSLSPWNAFYYYYRYRVITRSDLNLVIGGTVRGPVGAPTGKRL